MLTIGQLIYKSPRVNGNGMVWKEMTARAEAERTVLCKHLDGKALFTGMLHLYAAIHREMHDSLQPEQEESTEEFREQRRQKRNPSDEDATVPKKTAVTSGIVGDPRIRWQVELPTRNFSAPLSTEMEIEDNKEEFNNREQEEPTNQVGSAPPIILTSGTNLIQLQKHLRGIVKGRFEFRSTKNGTRVVTKEMGDFSAI
jgi:hypothetical protein